MTARWYVYELRRDQGEESDWYEQPTSDDVQEPFAHLSKRVLRYYGVIDREMFRKLLAAAKIN